MNADDLIPGVNQLAWDEVARRLADARCYWLHTTGPGGAPNASPVWGITLSGVLYVYSQSRTVKARNVAEDPRVVLHLESGADVVIVFGTLTLIGQPMEHPHVVQAFAEKYTGAEEIPFLPSSDPAFDVLYALTPQRALTWSLPDTEASTRRWTTPTDRAGSPLLAGG